jgi:ligand-binding sensor domain-containing protein
MTATTHDKPFFFQHLTMEDGLSNNHVSAIFQSKDGILWLGTQKGLNCYDGHNFRLYKKRDSSTANSIRGNGIKKILQDRDNNIWVQHEKGTDEIPKCPTWMGARLYRKISYRYLH